MRVKSYDLKTLAVNGTQVGFDEIMKTHENIRMLGKRETQRGQTGCQSDKLIKD